MQTGLWQIIILAVVQGVTEFLPVSSSGHVVIVSSLLPDDKNAALDVADVNIVLHVGTLMSIVVFYWRRIWRLLGEDRRTLLLLAVGTIPAVLAGVPLKLFFEDVLRSPLVAGVLLIVTGLILLWAARFKTGRKAYQQMSYRDSLLIGLSQAAAILPGISRSGSTISAGLSLGLSPRSAATYSFLLAIPVIAGAGVLEIAQLMTKSHGTTPAAWLAVGAAVSFVVGLVSLWWLVRWLERGRLHWFAWWCIPVGIAATAYHVWLWFGNGPVDEITGLLN